MCVCVSQSRCPVEPGLHSSNTSCFLFPLFCGAKLPNSDHSRFIFCHFWFIVVVVFFNLFHPHKRTHDHVKLAFTFVNIIKET